VVWEEPLREGRSYPDYPIEKIIMPEPIKLPRMNSTTHVQVVSTEEARAAAAVVGMFGEFDVPPEI
jgi:hypothetical protein